MYNSRSHIKYNCLLKALLKSQISLFQLHYFFPKSLHRSVSFVNTDFPVGYAGFNCDILLYTIAEARLSVCVAIILDYSMFVFCVLYTHRQMYSGKQTICRSVITARNTPHYINSLNPRDVALISDVSTLVQMIDWCHQESSYYLSKFWSKCMSPYGVIMPSQTEAVPCAWILGTQPDSLTGNLLSIMVPDNQHAQWCEHARSTKILRHVDCCINRWLSVKLL